MAGRSRRSARRDLRGSRPPSTLPPSSGGIGIMLNTASRTLSRSACAEQLCDRHRDVRLAERHRRDRQNLQSDRDRDREHQVARRTGGRHQDVIAPLVPQPPDVDRHRLRPADQRRVGHHGDDRKDHRADEIRMHQRVERHPAEQPRRRIAQPIGRPRMRAFVHGQGKQQNDESDEDLSERRCRARSVQVTADSRKTQERRRRVSAPTAAASSSRVARLTPATLPNFVSSAAAAAARRPAPRPAPIAGRASSEPGGGT